MAAKKSFRSDNTYLISTDTTDNPKLGAKVLSDGRESLYLDYYFGYSMVYSESLDRMVPRKDRKREYLSLYLWQAPRNPQERKHNKEALELAKKIRYEKGQELLNDREGYRLKSGKQDVDIIASFKSYLDGYSKKDKAVMKSAYTRFVDFLNDTPEYRKFVVTGMKPWQLTKDMMRDFIDYLKSKSNGTGAASIYGRFKTFVNYAIEHDVLAKNPCKGVSIKVDGNLLSKDVLSEDEVKALMATRYERQNMDVRRAFIFCLYTGMRFCDVKTLTYASVDYSNRKLSFEQNKVKGHSAGSGVVIPLNDGLLKLVGKGEPSELVFNLPTWGTCNMALATWTKRAGITKHITWHCARHTFATLILAKGANIKVVSSLLGHSGLQHTQKYTRAVDSQKQEAIDSMPELAL